MRVAGLAVHGPLALVPAAGYEGRHCGVDGDGGVGGDEAEGGCRQGQQLCEVIGDLGEEHASTWQRCCISEMFMRRKRLRLDEELQSKATSNYKAMHLFRERPIND